MHRTRRFSITAFQLLSLLSLTITQGLAQSSAIDVVFDVKEAAGTGTTDFPTHIVVPIAEGMRGNAAGLRVERADGVAVPAQFSVLNRWWARDNSVRHLLVRFPATVGAYSGAGSGISTYRLTTGNNPPPSDPVSVTDGATIHVRNQQLAIEIQRSPFSITTPSGELTAVFRDENNALRPTFERDDIRVEIEESGPVQATVRMSAPTRTQADGSILHGWAIRLYAYAGQSHVKLDVQLQNAAVDSALSGPLYMQSFELQLAVSGNASAANRRALLTATPITDPEAGALVKADVGLGIRQFYETWPNGVRRNSAEGLVAELFPAWSESQLLPNENINEDTLTASGSGLYWLEDMQAVIKEVVLDFSAGSQNEFETLMQHVQYPPVAVLPLDWYRKTEATLDLGGYISSSLTRPGSDDNRRTPGYPYQATAFYYNRLTGSFLLGWDEFLHSPQRKRAPRTAGSLPRLNADFIVTGNPRDYYVAADSARGELNVAPQWLPGYDHAQDHSLLQLTANPYDGPSWRQFAGNNQSHLRFDYLPGTRQDAKPRDDQHGWFYHVEQSYWFTADPWVKDWYEFVAEFRRVRLNQQDPFPDMSARGVAHSLNHAIQAYRVTGDTALLELLGNYLRSELMPRLNSVGAYTSSPGAEIATFQSGFLLRTLIDYLEELPGGAVVTRDADAFEFIEKTVQWNINIANFGYWRPTDETSPGTSNGTGLTLVDPQQWYVQQTGSSAAAAHVADFLDDGINGGVPPYGDFTGWKGAYVGRLVPLDNNQMPEYALPSDQWRQISLPCNPQANNTVAMLFADDGLGAYGDDWILWAYNPAANNYVNVGLNGILEQGIGYWIIQYSGSSKNLRMPASCAATPVVQPAQCASDGCFNVALATRPATTQWNMIGYPFASAANVADARVVTQSGACTAGCDLDAAAAGQITDSTLWTFTGANYAASVTSGNFEPWTGYWLVTLDAAQTAGPTVLMPKP
jgi:hypothetical protein